MPGREQEVAHLEKLRAIHRANIRDLEEKLALYGPLNRPSHLLREWESEQEELQRIEEELATLRKPVKTTPPVDRLPYGQETPWRVPVREILMGLFITVVGGIIVAWIIREGELFAPKGTPPTVTTAPAPTSTPTGAPHPDIELALWLEVKTSGAEEFVRGNEEGEYKSGDMLRFHFRPTADGYAYLFNIDTQGKFTPLWPNFTAQNAAQVRVDEDYHTSEFRLDQSEGWEQVFAVVSLEPFFYDEDIAPYLEPLPLPGGKGVDPVQKLLELREDRFFHKKITFAHLR